MDDESNLLQQAAQDTPTKRSKLATASFVCGALSLAGLILGYIEPAFVYLFLFFIVALVTGHLSRRAFRREQGVYSNESWATFGLAIGYLGATLSLFAIVVIIMEG